VNFTIVKKLPAPEEIIQSFPLSAAGYDRVLQDRQEVKDILSGNDPRLLIVVGPCSAWPDSAVLEYAKKLKKLNESVKKQLKLVMRVYIQKPRTTKGWTGPVNQPNPLAAPDIAAGVSYARKMMVNVIEAGLPIADEALFTHNAKGFMELLSWVAIGARSTEDQEHRIFASAIDCAVGMKNPTHGSLAIGINSVLAAQSAHVAVFDGNEVQTHGNPYAHLVLRGNNLGANYSKENLREIQRLMAIQAIRHPAVIVDASHDNCMVNGKKDFRFQPQVVEQVMEIRRQYPEFKTLVKGFMIESFIKEGCQKIDSANAASVDMAGLSITDGCLGWEKTEAMLLHLAEQVAAHA
jgi:3-deoxy-7-phosphoheptulonate synthase